MKHRISNKAETLSYLNDLGLTYSVVDHEVVKTVQEGLEKVRHPEITDFVFAKNLFWRIKNIGNFLITAHPQSVFNYDAFGELFKSKKGTCRGAEEKVLNEILGVQAGSVNPFSLINDEKKEVKFILDKALTQSKFLALHPMQNDSSVFIEFQEFNKFLEKSSISAQIIDFSEIKVEKKEEVKNEEKKKNPEEKKKNPEEKKPKEEKKQKEKQKEKEKVQENLPHSEEHTTLGMEAKKEEDFPTWYSQVITKSEMIDYYDVSGCYILKPWAYSMWETIMNFFDKKIKKLGVENCYFPMFVTEKQLAKESNHLQGFKPEVAWVTRSGDEPLSVPIAIRPTSETIMYPSFSKWIRSHRDLPLKLNQWTNVVRWEFKHPTPFIRTREFLWQEGHTAHATFEEADTFVLDILQHYKEVFEEILAVPVIKGIKTDNEKFAGAHYTSTIETAITANGKSIQCGTSHHLGQNFSKMFDIKFSDEKDGTSFAYQTSWGISTRSIGVAVMTHADDKGLVFSPRVAPLQVVFVPILYKDDADKKEILRHIDDVFFYLKKNEIKAKVDDRDNYNPGWKFNHWELKGVPVRVEFGSKDLKAGHMTIFTRDDGKKTTVKIAEVGDHIIKLMDVIHHRMFKKAKDGLDAMIKPATNFDSFYENLCGKSILLTAHCLTKQCEDDVLAKVKEVAEKLKKEANMEDDVKDKYAASAKTLCAPLEQEPIKENEKCFFCGKDAVKRVLWGKSY